jgi:hypothetical protein
VKNFDPLTQSQVEKIGGSGKGEERLSQNFYLNKKILFLKKGRQLK